MPALLARPGVQSLLLQQRSPSSSAQGQGTASWGWPGAGNGSKSPLALLLSSHRGTIQASLPWWDTFSASSWFFPADVMGQREKQMKWRTQKLKGTLKERTGFSR